MKPLELIEKLIADVDGLQQKHWQQIWQAIEDDDYQLVDSPFDFKTPEITRILMQAEMIVRHQFGNDSHYILQLKAIQPKEEDLYIGDWYKFAWRKGLLTLLTILETIKANLAPGEAATKPDTEPDDSEPAFDQSGKGGWKLRKLYADCTQGRRVLLAYVLMDTGDKKFVKEGDLKLIQMLTGIQIEAENLAQSIGKYKDTFVNDDYEWVKKTLIECELPDIANRVEKIKAIFKRKKVTRQTN